MIIFKNVAGQKIRLRAFDATTGLAKTGDAANLTCYVNIDWGGATALTDTSATEISSTNDAGGYLFDLTQAETNGNALVYSGKSSTANIVLVSESPNVVPAGFTALTTAAITDAIWDAPMADHLDSGSTGAALNGAGSAGDPWGTTLPGAYAAGTAGYIVGTNLDQPVSDPVTLSATGSAPLTEGYRANGATGTLAQLLYELVAHHGESAIAGTTKTIKKLDHSTTAETFVLDDAAAPSSVTRSS